LKVKVEGNNKPDSNCKANFFFHIKIGRQKPKFLNSSVW